MLEGSTQGRSAPVFLALSLLSAVFALDLSGSSGVEELSAHTLMAICVKERSGTVPALLQGGPKVVSWACPFHLSSHATMVYSSPAFFFFFFCYICKYLKLLPTKNHRGRCIGHTYTHLKSGRTGSQSHKLWIVPSPTLSFVLRSNATPVTFRTICRFMLLSLK